MKKMLVAAAVTFALGLGFAPAMAADGKGKPLPNDVGALSSSIGLAQAPKDTGSESYPSVRGRPGSNLPALAGDVLPADGNEGAVQTANSLPEHFEDRTVSYAQATQVQTWMLAHAARHAPSEAAIPAYANPRG